MKVPKSNYVFNNKKKFNPIIYKTIDSSYFYILVNSYWADKNFNKTGECGGRVGTVLQFYNNGNVREFAISEMSADPEYTGQRGVVYTKNNQIKVDLFSSISDGDMAILSYKVKIDGNKLYLLETLFSPFGNGETHCYLYEKYEKIPEDYKQYKADW